MAYVLIVDDDRDFAEATACVLRDEGYEVAIELVLDRALETMKARRPDLVVLDVMFPEESSGGFCLARKMRHYTEELANVPVLMLTAINTKFPLGFGERDIDDNWLPVSHFVEKPVDFDVLCAKVAELLRAAHPSSAQEGGPPAQ